MSAYSPSVSFNPAGGDLGGAGTALFNAATQGNRLNAAINNRQLDNNTLRSRIGAMNAHNANNQAWDEYNRAQGQLAHGWFNQHAGMEAQAPNPSSQGTAMGAASPFGSPTPQAPLDLSHLAGETPAYQHLAASTGTPMGAPTSAPTPQGQPQGLPSAPQQFRPMSPQLAMALSAQHGQVGTLGQAMRGIPEWDEHQLHTAQQSPFWQSAYQKALSEGADREGAAAAANATVFGNHPYLSGVYASHPQYHADTLAMQNNLNQMAGLGAATGDFGAYNGLTGLYPGAAPNGITHYGAPDANGIASATMANGRTIRAPLAETIIPQTPLEARARQDYLMAQSRQNDALDMQGYQHLLNELDRANPEDMLALKLMQLNENKRLNDARIEHYRNPMGIVAGGAQ